jgi:anti-sigma factor RsiW
MSCNETLRTQAYFDGELDAAEAMKVEQHLESCADCARLLADLDATRKILRQDTPYHRAGDALRKNIAASLDREEGVKPTSAPDASRRFLTGAASGAGAMLVAALLFFFYAAPAGDPLGADLMNAHQRSLMSDHLIDVASSDRHTVKPWFAGHTDVSPPAADFASEGYKLVGGRADYVDGHRAAVVVYRHGLHVINVFAWAATPEKLPGETTVKGYNITCWRGGDLDYCAVSDTGMDELLDLVRLIKQQ